jgi:hypothetical protein
VNRQGLNLLASRQEDQFREVQASMIATLSDVIRDQISSLPPWPKVGEKLLDQDIDNISSGFVADDQPPESISDGLVSIDQDFSAHTYAESCAKSLAKFELQQWESLHYTVLNDREDQIMDAERETFEWILRPPRDEHQPWSNFTNWLTSGDSIYWIQGKAGSGKSTMLKYLGNHPIVKRALDVWADKTPLVFLHFYFWHNGSILQKTQEGLLRSLLYQALENHRELLPAVFPETADTTMCQTDNAWTLSKLKAAFQRFLEQDLIKVKVCLMIDGLDEYMGDHTEIVAILRHASTLDHIKVCATSRPLLVFDRAFKGVPGLVMQHLTFDDINIYVKTKFRSDERFQELELEEPGLGPQLALQIVSKASGVFLWVRLVVNSLLEGILNYDRSSDLFKRLDELPDELEDLYQHMLNRVKPPWYLEESFRLLRLVQASNGNLTLLRLAFVELEQTPSMGFLETLTVEKQHAFCRKMAGRIKGRCLGLVEVSGAAHLDLTKLSVRFLHKSVSDFIDSPKMVQRMQSYPSIAIDLQPTGALLKGLVIELQTIRSRLHDRHFCIDDDLKRSTWYEEIRPLRSVGLEYLNSIAEDDRPKFEAMEDINDLTEQYWDMVKLKNPDENWRTASRSHLGTATAPRNGNGVSFTGSITYT